MADGIITVEVSTQDAQKRLLRLHRENARLRRRIMADAVTSDAAAANVAKLAQALAESKAEVQELIRANDALRIAARAALDEYGRLEWMADHGWLEVEMHKLRRALEGGE